MTRDFIALFNLRMVSLNLVGKSVILNFTSSKIHLIQ